jgi:hypothetical protein
MLNKDMKKNEKYKSYPDSYRDEKLLPSAAADKAQ